MNHERSIPDWELYERMVARLVADQLTSDLCVPPNARLKGRISGRSRQIDVLIDARHDTEGVAAVRQRIRIKGEKRWT